MKAQIGSPQLHEKMIKQGEVRKNKAQKEREKKMKIMMKTKKVKIKIQKGKERKCRKLD